ncbi:hypothetical protein [Paragemmobacter straminiformis]|uniref:Uncharacterized protein n=1 Tax=Paragemmobacter straminiformis TaxID=2045119 RepID=A0A842ICC1_9RHOB|nr:hypothetical protein [Gemmobacter straminiformis]MBC2837672.1 hypothetical protein [Gemmobacter straminiformis]
MGISTPKPKFDLAAFLSEKASPQSRRRPTWKRQAPAPEVEADDSAEAAPETPKTDD